VAFPLSVTRRVPPRALALAAALALLLSLAPAAYAEPPEQEVTVTPDDEAGWEGTIATGTNTDYDAQTGEPCGDGVEDQCETVLLHVNVPDAFWDEQGGGLQVHLDDYLPNPASDFDLYIYRANADGSRGELVAQSADLPGLPETAEIKQASGDYIVQVVYFAVTASKYTATTEFVLRDEPATPPDVDDPPGLQEALASNPSLGFPLALRAAHRAEPARPEPPRRGLEDVQP
jgi:hypothetical protein